MSSKAMYAAQSKFQVTNGLIINNGMLHGFENVSFLAKGISMDSIQHSQTIPYGLISGEGFIRYGYYPGRPEWTMEDRPLLDILGIRAIVGSAVELPPGSFLHKIGNLPPQNNRPSGLAVYANMGAFPRAFFIDPALLSKAKIKPHCGNNSYLVCQDLSNVTPAINPWQDPIQLEDRDDSISLLATPKPYARTILVSVMWRPEWSGVPDEMAVPVSSQWGLIKVILPANQSMVTLTYDSPSQNIGRLLTLLTAVFSILGVYVLRHRRGCVINL